ncbi:DUF4145 domain-containing protein [Muricomes sp. OA1]|uniref:DUF4145 domain-containing protein n=1 Tax=Clostridia TaxID=186801 RepID=UPI00067F0F09|nr:MULTISPECIES: DUF4145 domain-containing protein [Clostridia]MCH1973462.1 DUF4145 domain-containing protein [Muricomes sp. OA1]MDU7706056.1 DUF4145 domain-containing protein [Clostridium sp.]
MKISIGAHDANKCNQYPVPLEIARPSKCPRCQTSYAGMPEYAVYVDSNISGDCIYAIFYCPACEQCFYAEYDIISDDLEQTVMTMIYPVSESITRFSDGINELSPNFVSIYTQAEIAESTGLDKITGLGYRKALEFLIKDYAILLHPEQKEDIKKQLLSPCISKYIKNEKLQTLATASTWLGNDETHYIRKHEEYNIQHMKSFINAVVTLIDSDLSYREALNLLQSPK